MFSLFRRERNEEERKFFLGWEVDFKDTEELKRFIVNHAISKETFEKVKYIHPCLEFNIKDNTVVGATEHNFDIKSQTIVKETKYENAKLPLLEWEERDFFVFQKSKEGKHVIGGKKPESFTLPSDQSVKSKFTYLGMIDGLDPVYNWIGIERLHIAFPMMEYVDKVFLDYSDPNKPKIINPHDFKNKPYEPDLVNETIIYQVTKFKAVKDFNVQTVARDDELFCGGVPIWLQYPQCPMCPKTNAPMRFVCEISSDHDIKVIGNEKIKKMYESLMFGDYGKLYVFYHPVSKILCLFFQCG